MIIENYSTFRYLANPAGAIVIDGLPEFDSTKMRDGGFNGGFVLSSTSVFPLTITCNVGFADLTPGVDEYDWYVSQQTSVVANKPLTIARSDRLPTNSYSGTIEVDLAAWADAENPDPFDLSTIRVLFFGIDIYAIERAGGGLQRLNLMQYLLDALSPATDLE